MSSYEAEGRPFDHPIGRPANPSNNAADSPDSGPPARVAVPKDSPSTSSSSSAERRARRRVSRIGLEELSRLLLDRDLAVLQAVDQNRFLTTAHIQAMLFSGHATPLTAARTCRRVLRRLEASRLLTRPLRPIGGLQAGSASSVWMLTLPGRRLLNMRAGIGAVGKVREPGEGFVRHYLAIADVRVALIEADRLGRFTLLDVQIEPLSWRRYLSAGNASVVTLKPDMFIAAAGPRYEAQFYVEVDRGTESLPTVLKQCQLYEAYRGSGIDQERAGLFPRVLWVVPDETRADKLRAAIGNTRGLDGSLYLVTTLDGVVDVVRREMLDDEPIGDQA